MVMGYIPTLEAYHKYFHLLRCSTPMDRQGGRSFFFGSKERAALNDGQICSARPATRTQKVSVFWLLISHVLRRVNPPFLVGSHSHLRMVLIGYLVDHGISYLFLEVCWQFFLGVAFSKRI